MTAPSESPRITVSDIQRAVAARYGVTVLELRSGRRTKDLSRPRFIAIYIARVLTEMSTPSIGAQFGNRDHSTVCHAIKVVRQWISRDPELSDEIVEVSDAATRHAGSVWRAKMPASVEVFDASLNRIGLELAIVPIGSRDGNGFVKKGVHVRRAQEAAE